MKRVYACPDCPLNTARHNWNQSREVIVTEGAEALSSNQVDNALPAASYDATFPPIVIETPDGISESQVDIAVRSCNEASGGFRGMERLNYLARRVCNMSRVECPAFAELQAMQAQLPVID